MADFGESTAKRVQVCHQAVITVTVVNNQQISIAPQPRRMHDPPVRNGPDCGALRSVNIHALLNSDSVEFRVHHPTKTHFDDSVGWIGQTALESFEPGGPAGTGKTQGPSALSNRRNHRSGFWSGGDRK